MARYEKGKIYKLVCDNTDKIYIGSTIKRLCERMADHRSQHRRGTKNMCRSSELFDQGAVNIELIEEFPSNSKRELTEREQYWIDHFGDLCVNNKNPGNKWTKEVQAEYIKQYRREKWADIYAKRKLNDDKLEKCECGRTVKHRNMCGHRKTDLHKNLMDEKECAW